MQISSYPNRKPVIAFLAVSSGTYEGAVIHHLRVAVEFKRRGYDVVIYWAFRENAELIGDEIPQSVLQLHGLDRGVVPLLLGDLEAGAPLILSLAECLQRDRVTHVVPTTAIMVPFVEAAQCFVSAPFEILVVFQGEEVFTPIVAAANAKAAFYANLRRIAMRSARPVVALSVDYADFMHREFNVPRDRIVAVEPGVPDFPAPGPFDDLVKRWPWLRRDVPLITYVGRHDVEKGLDLLLYALRLMRQDRRRFQAMLVGASLFTPAYRAACDLLTSKLQLDDVVHRFEGILPGSMLMSTLYANSSCVVYPYIHHEPFGIVPLEALACGAPVVVPDIGGVADVIRHTETRGGLQFRAWDSRDLARQLTRACSPRVRSKLSKAARRTASEYHITREGERLLAAMGLPPYPPKTL